MARGLGLERVLNSFVTSVSRCSISPPVHSDPHNLILLLNINSWEFGALKKALEEAKSKNSDPALVIDPQYL
ncbi:hypothetical protein HDU91_000866, partial [Kappamyces sp. JEL0680]